MKIKMLFLAIFALAFTNQAKSQDSTALVSAFFGLDNALPLQANFLCPGASGMDGMPVNFKFPIDGSSLSATDFEVIDSLGSSHTPLCAVLAPANENGENRTVLLIGEFGNANSSPPVEVRIIEDLFTSNSLPGESACAEVMNLNGLSTTNVVPLSEGPSIFFAQKIEGAISDCGSGTQTIQVAWNGGVTPFISGDTESDLFQYYVGYSDSSGILIPHVPIAIADTLDNDNYHQLCFATSDTIIKISMMAATVEDPNQDPNLYSEIDVSFCEPITAINEDNFNVNYTIYPNPFFGELHIENLQGGEFFVLTNCLGNRIMTGACPEKLEISDFPSGIYYLSIMKNKNRSTYKVMKQ